MLGKMDQTGFVIDDWQVSPAEGVLSRGSEVVHLEPKVMEVLVYFASHVDEVITREELEANVWRGAVVGYDAVTKAIIKLRKALQDDARHPRYIVTIPKKGYQLIMPVISPAFDKTTVEQTTSTHNYLSNSLSKQKTVFGILVFLIFITAYGVFYSSADTSKGNTSENSLPIVLVLPFENLVVDKQDDTFVDGITEDIITDLSRLSNLFVFASNTSFQYKGKQVSPQQLKKELNVDYVLKGSVRRIDDSLRLNTQLVDAKTNLNIWAERYDRKIKDVFAIQSELTQHLVNALTLKLTSYEKQYLVKKSTLNLKAYEHFLAGQRISKQRTKEANELARIEFRQAIELDPSYGRVYGALAFSMTVDYRRGWTDTPIETLDRALALAEQATRLDTNTPQTYWVLGYVYMIRRELNAAKQAVKKAITIAPNYADGYGLLALINNQHGNAVEALKLTKKGMLLNPYYTWDYPYNLGRAYYSLGRYDEAITVLEQAQERNESTMPPKLFLTASYIKAGRIDDAQWLVEQIQVLTPGTTVEHIRKTIPIDNKTLKKDFLNDLRQAGLPENN